MGTICEEKQCIYRNSKSYNHCGTCAGLYDEPFTANQDAGAKLDCSDVLRPSKFGVRSCGVTEDERGTLFQQEDMVKALEYVLDDDDCVSIRAEEFLEYLRP